MIIKEVLRNKLHMELINNGIEPITVFAIDESDYGADITFAEGTNMVLVQQIIDTHDPIPSPTPLSEIDKLKISQAEQFETILMLIGGM